MIEYITQLQWYLHTQFNLNSYLYPYKIIDHIPNEYINANLIFVQKIEPKLIPKQFPTTKLFLLNTEQTSIKSNIDSIRGVIKKYPEIQIIDYSLENIEILKHYCNPLTTFIHFPYPFFYMSEPIEKSIAVCSLMSSPFRRKICSQIERDLQIHIQDFTGLWGDKRDNLIKKSLILLNLHFDNKNYKIFESIRCYRALEQGTLIISEDSFNNDSVLLKDYIIFSPISELSKTIMQVLSNFEDHYNKIFNRESMRCANEIIKETFIKSIQQFASYD